MARHERRGAARQPLNLHVHFADGYGETRDVSASGVCFQIPASPPTVGSRIEFKLDMPSSLPERETSMRFEAEVTRVEEVDGGYAVAAKFLGWKLVDA